MSSKLGDFHLYARAKTVNSLRREVAICLIVLTTQKMQLWCDPASNANFFSFSSFLLLDLLSCSSATCTALQSALLGTEGAMQINETDWCSCELKVIAANSHIFPALTRCSHTLHTPKLHCCKWDQSQLEHLLFEYPHVCRFIREDITLWNHINGLIVPFYDFKLALCVAAMSVWNKSRLSARVCGFFSQRPGG